MRSSEPTTRPPGDTPFQLYLQRHNLSPLDVALTAGVRYMTVWRMMRGLLIRREDDMVIRQGLFRLTGEWYMAPMVVRGDTHGGDAYHTQ